MHAGFELQRTADIARMVGEISATPKKNLEAVER
jgi:hypothetical protein